MTRRVLRGFDRDALVRARGETTVSDLARLAGVARRTLQLWESGATTPEVDNLARVCEVLNIQISALIAIDADATYPADLRVLAGLTQPELGRRVGLSTQTVGTIERAQVTLSQINCEALAAVVGVTADEYGAAYQRARQRPAGTPA